MKGSYGGVSKLVTVLLVSIASPQPAKAYPIDCAILLCLAGGWPNSSECASARAEFIRRITPWPVEPPLQIWRCPMASSSYSVPRMPPQPVAGSIQAISLQISEGGGADIDISGAAFEFFRSIRVWDIRYYSHQRRGRDDDCSEQSNMWLGTYGLQGEFNWQRTNPEFAPGWALPSRACSSSNWRRGVGVEWEDYEGNHGYEWVDY